MKRFIVVLLLCIIALFTSKVQGQNLGDAQRELVQQGFLWGNDDIHHKAITTSTAKPWPFRYIVYQIVDILEEPVKYQEGTLAYNLRKIIDKHIQSSIEHGYGGYTTPERNTPIDTEYLRDRLRDQYTLFYSCLVASSFRFGEIATLFGFVEEGSMPEFNDGDAERFCTEYFQYCLDEDRYPCMWNRILSCNFDGCGNWTKLEQEKMFFNIESELVKRYTEFNEFCKKNLFD